MDATRLFDELAVAVPVEAVRPLGGRRQPLHRIAEDHVHFLRVRRVTKELYAVGTGLRALALDAHRRDLFLLAGGGNFVQRGVANAPRSDLEADYAAELRGFVVVEDLEVKVVVERVAHRSVVPVLNENASHGIAVLVVHGTVGSADVHDTGEVIHQDLRQILIINKLDEFLDLLLIVVHFANGHTYHSFKIHNRPHVEFSLKRTSYKEFSIWFAMISSPSEDALCIVSFGYRNYEQNKHAIPWETASSSTRTECGSSKKRVR